MGGPAGMPPGGRHWGRWRRAAPPHAPSPPPPTPTPRTPACAAGPVRRRQVHPPLCPRLHLRALPNQLGWAPRGGGLPAACVCARVIVCALVLLPPSPHPCALLTPDPCLTCCTPLPPAACHLPHASCPLPTPHHPLPQTTSAASRRRWCGSRATRCGMSSWCSVTCAPPASWWWRCGTWGAPAPPPSSTSCRRTRRVGGSGWVVWVVWGLAGWVVHAQGRGPGWVGGWVVHAQGRNRPFCVAEASVGAC